MSKLKIKDTAKQDTLGDEVATPPEETLPTPNQEPTTDYGVGGVYRSIGGGKRVKI